MRYLWGELFTKQGFSFSKAAGRETNFSTKPPAIHWGSISTCSLLQIALLTLKTMKKIQWTMTCILGKEASSL